MSGCAPSTSSSESREISLVDGYFCSLEGGNMGLSSLDLARVQFAFTISFHIIFPAITIGLALFLALMEGLWLKTRNAVYMELYEFWVKFFAVAFGMGVVSGVVMAYQFGTNWSEFSKFSGGVTGPLLTYEVLTAFFLEAGFLGVMLFGRKRVGEKLHFFATLMVALGTFSSAFWIIVSNSWMQTPAGVEIIDGVAVPVDWWAVIFNPSLPIRLAHMLIATFNTTSLIILAVAAWHLLKGHRTEAIMTMQKIALTSLIIFSIAQVVVGDFHGLNVLEHQPHKLAAIEGHWDQVEEGESTPLILIGFPDQEGEKTHFSIEVPYLASIILTHSLDGQIPVLKDFAPEDRPPVAWVFWSFRVMVGLGFLMVALALWGAWLQRKGVMHEKPLFLRFSLLMGPSGLIAILAGWFTTEIGRQPWTVQGLLRTVDSVSNHDASQLSLSLLLFVITYAIIFGTGIIYLFRILGRGPQSVVALKESREEVVA